MNQKIEKDCLRDIESGKYKHCYLIYNRKSTDEPDNQKNSIQYQKAENTRFAVRNSLQIAALNVPGFCINGVISEKHSGFKEANELYFGTDGTVQYRIERPKFYTLAQFLNKGYFKGVICLCWDRASRNKGDNTIIEKLIKGGSDFRFTLASYDNTSSGALHMDIDGMVAQHHSRVTSEKVRLNIKDQRSKGICTYKAPVGYLNTGSMENKPFDPIRAPIIKNIFELYATGTWTLADLSRWANAQGFTMPPVRRRRTEDEILLEEEDELKLQLEAVTRPVTYNNIHKILTNPFYTGKILGLNGEYVPSRSHTAIISDKLFNDVQDKLKGKKVSVHYASVVEYPYRGLIRCAYCKRTYTPYVQKGFLYYGSRCAKECPNRKKSVNQIYIEKQLETAISRIYFTDDELVEFDARIATDIAMYEVKRRSQQDLVDRQKRKIREDLTYLLSNKLQLLKTGVYTPESLTEEEKSLQSKLYQLQEEEQLADVSVYEAINDTKKLSELLKSLYLLYKSSNPAEKEQIIRMLYSELLVSEKGLEYKCRNGLEVLDKRSVALGDPTGWISEAVSNDNLVQTVSNSLEEFLCICLIPP